MRHRGNLIESTAPAIEPVTLAEVIKHLRLSGGDEDDLVEQLIKSARRMAENFCASSFIDTTWIWYREFFSDVMIMPVGPLDSVTDIKYLDSGGSEQTLASSVYQVDTKHRLGRVVIDVQQNWPTISSDKVNPVFITFKAGFGTATTDVPDAIKDAILRMIGTLYETREDCSIDSPSMLVSKSLLTDYRLRFSV